MMHTQLQQPVHSEYRQYQSPFLRQWFQPYILQEHVTTASHQYYENPFVFNPNRQHRNIKLDDQHSVQALVNSVSSICLGDSSLVNHIKAKYPNAPPINVTDVHGGRKQYKINIHMQDNLSSELVLGTDFLADHGAVINVRSNKVIFLPTELFPVSLSTKPIVCEVFASVIDQEIPIKDLNTYNMTAFAVQPTEDVTIPFMDQKIIHVKIMKNQTSMVHKPNTTFMLTSGMAPDPQIPEGLYSIDHEHSIRITIRNSSTGLLVLKQNRPIPGIVAHDLTQEYHEPVEITRETLRAMFLKDQTIKAAKLAGVLPQSTADSSGLAADHPDYMDPTPEQYIASVMAQFEEASSLLQASGLEPPGVRRKPTQGPTQAIRDNLLSQFDSSGIDKEYVQDYINAMMRNWDVFSLHKYDVGHTPHWEHKIEPTSNEPVFVKQFKIAVGDEEALDEMSTHLTAAKILIQQPSDNNTPIFMVAKRGGPHQGKKRFVQDFRKRNAASKDDKYTIKDVRESLVAVGRLKPKIWSKLDFTGAFYCLSLEKESQKLTSFTLPFKSAQYSWARMPQGLKGASASFSKLCQIIFRHMPNIITYVDDLVGATTNHQEMIQLLEQVFAECRYHGMKLNLKKCQFGLESLSWLGYNLSSNGISPEIDKAEAVKSMVLPKTIKEIQSHLGLFQFFADLIDNYALIAGPLSAVTSPDHPWRSFVLSGDLPQEAQDSWFKLRNID